MSVYYITNDSIDNFEQYMQCFYAGVEDKILNEEELKEQHKEELYKDTTIFESDSPFIGYPIRENNTIRPATRIELINMGYQELEDGEYIENNEIIKINSPDWRFKWNKELKQWLPDESLLNDGEYFNGTEIVMVPYPEDMINPIWNKESHVWEETATENEINLFMAKSQYDEYKPMDTPLTFESMQEQGILEEYKSMMHELENIILTLSELEVSTYNALVLPEPSEALLAFKNKFNKIK